MAESALKRAQRSLAINDVYVSDVSAWADQNFDPQIGVPQPSNLQISVAHAKEAEIMAQPQNEPAPSYVRYFVETGVRLLKPSVDQTETELTKDQLLAEITATFIVRYDWVSSDDPPTAELLASFSNNAIHHMWPYWREFLQASMTRLRLPPFVLPMRAPQRARPQATEAKAEESSE